VAGTVVAPVVAGLVVGAAFVVLFALHDFARESIMSDIISLYVVIYCRNKKK
jgi:hypothetical protein